MIFRGLDEYRTSDPGALRADLQRQNQAVRDALSQLLLELEHAPAPRIVRSDTTATHGEALLVDATAGDVRVTLPKSSPASALRSIMIISTAGLNSVIVAASPPNLIGNSSPTETISLAHGLRRYYDDGQGSWWRSI